LNKILLNMCQQRVRLRVSERSV